MTAVIETIVWFCAGTAAGIAIDAWIVHRLLMRAEATIDELLAANRRLRGHIAMLEKSRKADNADWWKDN